MTRAGWTFRSAALILAVATLNEQAFGHGAIHEQIEAATGRIAKSPKSAELYLQRAELHRVHQDWQEATADYDRAAQLDPGLKAVHLGRGKLLLGTGRFEEAKQSLGRFLVDQPADVDGLVTLGRVEARNGEPLAAAGHLSSAIAHSTTPEPDFYLECAKSLVAAGDEHLGEAVRTLDDGLAKLGRVPALGLYAIELEVSQQHFDAALDRIDRFANVSARKERWLERRGDILSLAGRADEGTAAYTAALAAISKLPAHLGTAPSTLELRQRISEKLSHPKPTGHE